MARRYGYASGDLNTAASQGFDLGVEGAQRKRKSIDEQEAALQARGFDLQKLLAGEAYKAKLKEEADQREGENEAGALNDLLSKDTSMSRRLGLTKQQPDTQMGSEFSPDPATFAGGETYEGFNAKGRGAGAAAKYLKSRIESFSKEDAQAATDRRTAELIAGRREEGNANRATSVRVADIRSQSVQRGIELRRELAASQDALRRWQTITTEAGKNARTDVMAGATSMAGKAPAIGKLLADNQAKLHEARMIAAGTINDTTGQYTDEDKQNALLTVESAQRIVTETQALFDAASRVGQKTADKVAPPKAGAPAPTPGASVEFIRDPVTRKIIRKQ